MREMWPHLIEGIENIRKSVAQGVRKIVFQSPTGSGKTSAASALVERAQRKGNRMAFVVSQISLIDQTVENFYADGIRNIGVIQADHHMTDWSQPVQVCSIQTLQSRGKFPNAQAVIFDECHVLYEYHKLWLRHPDWQDKPFIGLSATPWTKGLGKYFDSLLVAATTEDLIKQGILSPFRVFATGHPDLTGVRTVAGDFHEGDLSEAMQRGGLTADIVRTWQQRWNKDKTLVFCVDCKHAQAVQARFLEAGISCAYQDADTPRLQRREIKAGFHSGKYRVVTNVGTLTTGVDWDVRCLSLCRPTKSEILYVQILGRALRLGDGKDYAMILDHSDTTERLGFVTDIHHDHLDMGKKKEKSELRKPRPKPCPKCDCMLPRVAGKCVNCGHVMEKGVSGLVERDGELFEIIPGTKPKKPAPIPLTIQERRNFLSGLKFIALERKRKESWASVMYKEKFHHWPEPEVAGVLPASPTMEARQWVKHCMIRYRYSKAREERMAAHG